MASRTSSVPNDLSTKHHGDSAEQFHDALCGDWYASHKETVDAFLAGNAVIEAIPVGGSAKEKTSTEGLSRTQYCERRDHKLDQSTYDQFWSRIVPESARHEWGNCIAGIQRSIGPHPIKVDLRSAGDAASLAIRYDSNLGGAVPRLISVTTIGVTCNDIPMTKPLMPSLGDGLSLACSWKSDDTSVATAIVHTTRGDEVMSAERVLTPYVTVQVETHTPTRSQTGTESECTGWAGTTDMHEWKTNKGDGRCTKATEDGKWCKGDYHLSLTSRHGGTLHTSRLECNGDACTWNDLPNHSWYNPATGPSVSVEFWAGSHGINVRLCSDEALFDTRDVVTRDSSFSLGKGGGFVVEVPAGSSAILNIKPRSGDASALRAGDSNHTLSVVDTVTVGSITKISYHVNR